MLERSFQLKRKGDEWWATFSGFTRPFEVKCGDGSKEAAEEFARATLKRRGQQADAGKQRWRATKVRQLSPAAGSSTPLETEEQTPVDRPPPIDRPPPVDQPPPPPDEQPEADPPPSPSPERAAQIRAKLLALGDGRPIEPDSVHRPGESPRAETNDDPPMDEEAGELLADLISGAVVMGHVKFVAGRMKKRAPPQRPGEPNERMMGWVPRRDLVQLQEAARQGYVDGTDREDVRRRGPDDDRNVHRRRADRRGGGGCAGRGGGGCARSFATAAAKIERDGDLPTRAVQVNERNQEVPSVPQQNRETTGAALRSLPPAEQRGEAAASRPTVAAAARSTGGQVRPAREAWFGLAAPLRRKKGIRVLFFGITTKGKTHGLADFIDYVNAAQLVDVTLIHDVKKPAPQYEGAIIHEATDIYVDPPEGYPARRVLRRRNLDHMPSVETAARVTLETAYQEVSAMLVVDEFARALNDGGKWDSASAERIWCEGADFGASGIGTKQLPQYTPTSAVAQSDLVIFGLNGKGASYLVEEKYIPPAGGELVSRLDQRHFVVVPAEGNFDGHVYEVPMR
jgi:hypothetical protein